ncbi:MAG: hypothetical protein ISS18_16165 [Bacteroidales bacterium]|nr:hypothetical protein [Bacteroidales bacterium]
MVFGFLILVFHTNAQQIQNIRFEQEGKKINIYYDLIGNANEMYSVNIYYRKDGLSSWGEPLKSVSGDVGEIVIVGNNKHIIWEVLADRDNLIGKISFKITVELIIPIALVIGLKDGKISKGNILLNPFLVTYFKISDNKIPADCKITSFSMWYKSDSGKNLYEQSNSQFFTEKMKSIIQELESGTIIRFENIKINSPIGPMKIESLYRNIIIIN